MASQQKLLAAFLALNLALFTTVSACGDACVPKPKPKPIPLPKPKPAPCPPPPGYGGLTCPIDTLKLGVCADVLGGLLGLVIGTPPKEPCCTLIEGLVDLEAAVCLCTALKADILGIHLDIPISLSLLLNVCGKTIPPGWQCP